MPKKKPSKQSSKREEKKSNKSNNFWQEPAVEVVLFETIEKLRPYNLHSHISALNCYHALKKYLGLSVSPRQILDYLRNELYEMPVLDEDAKPVVKGRKDFELPAALNEKEEKPKKQAGVRNRNRKKSS